MANSSLTSLKTTKATPLLEKWLYALDFTAIMPLKSENSTENRVCLAEGTQLSSRPTTSLISPKKRKRGGLAGKNKTEDNAQDFTTREMVRADASSLMPRLLITSKMVIWAQSRIKVTAAHVGLSHPTVFLKAMLKSGLVL